jgi:hypothetical protein
MPETDGVRSYLRRSQIKGSLPFGAGARPLALMFPLVCCLIKKTRLTLRVSRGFTNEFSSVRIKT